MADLKRVGVKMRNFFDKLFRIFSSIHNVLNLNRIVIEFDNILRNFPQVNAPLVL